jgi:hypothetical protein
VFRIKDSRVTVGQKGEKKGLRETGRPTDENVQKDICIYIKAPYTQ